MFRTKYHRLDFLIITALDEEFQAVIEKFSSFETSPFGINVNKYSEKYFEIDDYKIIAICINDMGRVKAALVTARAIRLWNPQVILLVGIAGGVKDKVNLGDVIIPKTIYDYELRKFRKEKKEGEKDKIKESWRGILFDVEDILFNHASPHNLTGFSRYIRKKRPNSSSGNKISLKHGLIIASGDKSVAVSDVMNKLKKERDHLIGIEMEGAGVASAVKESEEKPHFLMIRSVSDFADEAEDKKETQEWREYACHAAAAASRKLIEVLIKEKVYDHFKPDPTGPLKAVINANKVNDIMEQGYPIVFICDFRIYRELAIAISKSSTDFLLWSLHGSPLNIPQNYLDRNKLTIQDKEFRDIECQKKLRVVIFRLRDDVEKYVEANAEAISEHFDRLKAFEESCKSNGGVLYFTCQKLLRQELTLPREFDFDFGFVSKPGIDIKHAGYCFHSPFNIKSVMRKLHVSFFDIQKLSPGLMSDIKNGARMKEYNIILQCIPHYPKIVENFRSHLDIDTQDSQLLDEIVLYNEVNDLLERCKICNRCNTY